MSNKFEFSKGSGSQASGDDKIVKALEEKIKNTTDEGEIRRYYNLIRGRKNGAEKNNPI
jgi:hypothetical protein